MLDMTDISNAVGESSGTHNTCENKPRWKDASKRATSETFKLQHTLSDERADQEKVGKTDLDHNVRYENKYLRHLRVFLVGTHLSQHSSCNYTVSFVDLTFEGL